MRVHWERYGDGEPTILLLPTWSIVHSRHWKGQIADLARQVPGPDVRWTRQRPIGPTDGPRGLRRRRVRRRRRRRARRQRRRSSGHRRPVDGRWLRAADGARPPRPRPRRRPHRRIGRPRRDRGRRRGRPGHDDFDEVLDTDEGWAKYNAPTGDATGPASPSGSSAYVFSEPHSTKQIEDSVGWALETEPETLITGQHGAYLTPPPPGQARGASRPCSPSSGGSSAPAWSSTASDDHVTDHSSRGPPRDRPRGAAGDARRDRPFADRARAREGQPAAARVRRQPAAPAARRRRPGPAAAARPPAPGALPLLADRPGSCACATSRSPTSCAASSPTSRSTGWPSTRSPPCWRPAASAIHPPARSWPASRRTSRARRPSTTCNAFQAIRRMDEILVANFMVFHDVVETGEYDLVIGDEAWDVDHFLHENPELKRTAFAWLTDFVGWLPMPDGGEREAYLTADYNAEMIEHVDRFPRIRDRAIFVGEPDDIVPDDFGPGLPLDPGVDRAPLRVQRLRHGLRPAAARSTARRCARELGYRADERVVHRHGRRLRRRRRPAPTRDRAAIRRPRERVPGLRMIAVAGPRIDPASLPRRRGRRGPRLCPRSLPAPRRLRSRRRPGRPDHHDGARGGTAAVPVLPAAQPLRAEPPRPASAGPLRGGPPHGLRGLAAGGHRRRDRRGDRPSGRLPAGRDATVRRGPRR